MSQKIASLYAEIGADTKGIDRGLKETKSGLKDTARNFDSFKSTMLGITGAAAAVGVALKKTYDVAKQGAALEYTRDKFDRLSNSIHTTSSALLTELRDATRGTYSDFELMANVTDLVGLGLVKNKDEAIRLSRVASGLNMNMSQLVLTLTNMTTMRFDALGVSVDGFDDKLKGLEAQGYNTNDAFKEAFLQQAEMQLSKVGEAADSAIGPFQQLEANWKNLLDTAKQGTADAVLPFVEGMNKSVAVQERMNELIDSGVPKHLAYRAALREIEQGLPSAAKEQIKFINSLEEGKQKYLEITGATRDYASAVKEIDYGGMVSLIGNIQSEQDGYNQKLGDFNDKMQELIEKQNGVSKGSKKWKEYQDQINEVRGDVQGLKADHEDAFKSIALDMVAAKLAADGWTEAEFNAYLQVGQQLGQFTSETVQAAMDINNQVNTIVENYDGIAAAGVRAGQQNQILADRMTFLTGAAMLADPALVNVKDDMKEIASSALNAGEKVEAVGNKVNSVDGAEATVTINVITKGGFPGAIGSGGGAMGLEAFLTGDSTSKTGDNRAMGGPVFGSNAYHVTENGMPELLNLSGQNYLMMPPGTSGQVIPLSGAQGQGASNINITIQAVVNQDQDWNAVAYRVVDIIDQHRAA